MSYPNPFTCASLLYARYELYCNNPYLPYLLSSKLYWMPRRHSCVPLALRVSHKTSTSAK